MRGHFLTCFGLNKAARYLGDQRSGRTSVDFVENSADSTESLSRSENMRNSVVVIIVYYFSIHFRHIKWKELRSSVVFYS